MYKKPFSSVFVRCCAYWLLKKLTKVIAMDFMRADIGPCLKEAMIPEGFALVVADSVGATLDISADILDKISGQTGSGVASRVANGDIVYALVNQHGDVSSQIVISTRFHHVSFPANIKCKIPDHSSYASFLYTWEKYRGCGHGEKLMKLVMSDLYDKEKKSIYCDVLSTNVASIRTLRKCGWRKVATIFSHRGRFMTTRKKIRELDIDTSDSCRQC